MIAALETGPVALADPVAHDTALTAKASFPQFPPELRGVVTALLPTLIEIAGVSINCAGAARRFAFRKSIRAHPAAHGSAVDSQLAANLPLGHAAFSQRHYLFIAVMATLAVVSLQEPSSCGSRNCRSDGRRRNLRLLCR